MRVRGWAGVVGCLALLGLGCGGSESEDGPGRTEAVAGPQRAPEPSRATAAAASVVWGAVADGFVLEAEPSRNLGTLNWLESDSGPRAESYLKFTVEGVTSTVTSATLRLWVSNATSDGPRVHPSENGWTEGGLTWASRPALRGTALTDLGSVPVNSWLELDVTAVVTGNGTYSFALVPTGSDGLDVFAREHADSSRRPQLVLTMGDAPPPPPPPSTSVVTLAPQADAHVEAANPSRNAGTTRYLLVDGSPTLETYLKFSVTGLSAPIVSARLRLWVTNETTDGPQVYPVGTGWTETGITWSSRPARTGAQLADLGAVAAGRWMEVDVSAAVTGEGTFAFGLVPTGGNGIDFHSRESVEATLRPQLVLTLDDDSPPPPPPPPSGPETFTFAAEADAYLDHANTSQNAGAASTLMVDASPELESLVRFNVSGLRGPVTSARLRLWVTNATSDGPRVFRSEPNWFEHEVSWQTRPARLGTALVDFGAMSSGTFVEVDVTAVVQANSAYSFALVPTSTDGVQFASREFADESRRPRLTVQAQVGGCTQQRVTRERVVHGVSGYVAEASPETNFMGSGELRIDGVPREESYLWFSNPTAATEENLWAKLRLYAFGTEQSPLLYKTDPWATLFDLTWNTRPAIDQGPFGHPGTFQGGQWMEWNMPTLLTSRPERLYLGLLPNGDTLSQFDSGRSSAPFGRHPPQLSLRLAETYTNRCGTGGETLQVQAHDGPYHHDKLYKQFAAPDGGFAAVWVDGETPIVQPAKLTRFNAQLEEQWTRHLPSSAAIAQVAITSLGNVLVAGTYSGAPDLGGGSLPWSEHGVFLLKLSPVGNHTWSRGFPASDEVQITALGTGADGSLNFAGWTAGLVDLGSGGLSGSFAARFLWDATHVWSFGGESIRLTQLVVDSAGNVVFGANVPADSIFRGQPTGARGTYSIFLSRVSAEDGAELWRRVIFSQDSASEAARLFLTTLASGPDGTVAFGGWGYGDFVFAGRPVVLGNLGSDFEESVVGKLRNDGTELWALAFQSFIEDQVTAVGVASDGAVTVGGYTRGTIDLGAGPMGGEGQFSNFQFAPYVARFDAEGRHLWSRLGEEPAQGFARVLPLAGGEGLILAVLSIDTPGYHFDGNFWSGGHSDYDTLLIRLGP